MSLTLLVDSTSPQAPPAVTVAPTAGSVHVDDVTEGVLGVGGDADPDGAVARRRTHSCSAV